MKASAPMEPQSLILQELISSARPQRPGAQQLSIDELNYSTQAMQPKSQFSSGNSAYKASALRSPAAQFEELNYSTQAMQPKSQFSSGTSAYKASAPGSPTTQLEGTQLLYSGPYSPEASTTQAFGPRSLSSTV